MTIQPQALIYPRDLQEQVASLARELADHGITWDRKVPMRLQVRRHADLPLPLEHRVRVLFAELRQYYRRASTAKVNAFLEEVERRRASAEVRVDAAGRKHARELADIAAYARKHRICLPEDMELVLHQAFGEPLIPEVVAVDDEDFPTAVGSVADDEALAHVEEDFMALWKLNLAIVSGRLHVDATAESAASARLLRHAIETGLGSRKDHLVVLNDAERRILAAITGAARTERLRREGMRAVLETVSAMVAQDSEAQNGERKAPMDDLLDLLWRMRRSFGPAIDLYAIDWERVSRSWRENEEVLEVDVDRLDAYRRELLGDPECDEGRWWQSRAPPPPLGWRAGIEAIAAELASFGIAWHPQNEILIEVFPDAEKVPPALERRINVLHGRLLVWWLKAATTEETRAFIRKTRTSAEAWCLAASDVGMRRRQAYREGGVELHRIVRQAEALSCPLVESVGWVEHRFGTRDHPVIVARLADGKEPAIFSEKRLTARQAYESLWRLRVGLDRLAAKEG